MRPRSKAAKRLVNWSLTGHLGARIRAAKYATRRGGWSLAIGFAMVRRAVIASIVVMAAAGLPARAVRHDWQDPNRPDPKNLQLLAATRAALGGEAALDAINSFSVNGPFTRDLGPVSTNSSLEISCVLPDRFVRVTSRTSSAGPLGT